MGEAVLQQLQELDQLDVGVHWFCPRASADDDGLYFDEDVSPTPTNDSGPESKRQRQIDEAVKRRDTALDVAQILAFDGADAKPFQDQYQAGLKTQLTRCDICVREFHRARALLAQRLEAQYEMSEVNEFMIKFDSMNFKRINEGLETMTAALLDLPPDQRNIAAAGDIGMYALFEALHCVPFLKDEEALESHFDRPFRLVQTKKTVKLPSYAPGMGAFMFSYHPERSSWATKVFSSMKRPLTVPEFEYSVRPFLEDALNRVNIMALEKEFLPTFWRAARLISSKLTKDLVTDHLRIMDNNLYTSGLEHFQIEDDHFSDLLGTYQTLLELSPNDFWEAMGSISAQIVAETIFRCPGLQTILKTTQEAKPLHLEEKMEWTLQLVKSVKPSLLVPPVKIILDQLLHVIQTDQYSNYARSVCWHKGLLCLLTAARTMKEHVKSGPTIAHMVQIVATDHISVVMQELDGVEKKTEMHIDRNEQLCLDIVEHILGLDVTGLAHDRQTLMRTKALDHELGVSGLEVWKRSMRHVKPGHAFLPAAILRGIKDLLQLETFAPRQIEASGTQAESWNHALKRIQRHVRDDLLERLDSFSADQLEELFILPSAAHGLVNLLFNGDSELHQPALDVLKNMSGQDDRRGSIMYIVSAWNHTSLPAVNEALLRISRFRIFTPCPTAIKIGADIFDCLCNTQDGILRSKKLSEESLKHVDTLWQRTWQFLGMIFEQTEQWSSLGYGKDVLHDFCRETMDFAENVFNQYSIVASTLQSAFQETGPEVRRKLLEHPKIRFMHIAKWLRLRDDYLITKAVSLTGNILGRLREVDIEIDDDAVQYLRNMVTGTEKTTRVRTKLSMSQKAELQSALEKHTGESFSETTGIFSERPKKQGNLEGWATSARDNGVSASTGDAGRGSRPGTIDVYAWTDAARQKKEQIAAEDAKVSRPGSEAYKKMLQQQQQQQQQAKKASTIGHTAAKTVQKQQDQNDFLAQRRKEREENEKRKAAAVAKMTATVGSGLAGLGDIGKDHTMKGRNVMLSSDEESGDDEDEDGGDMDNDLFGIKKKIAKPNVDPNGAVGLRPEQKNAPTRIHKTQRSLKDRRARLAPDLTQLHRIILKWDFFHDGDYPPGANEHQFKEVANRFMDPVTYQGIFQPLLTLEAWQGLVKAREESTGKPYEVKIQNRTNVDQFIEISSLIGHDVNREISIQEGDIMLLSKVKNATADATVPHCLARVYKVKRQKAGCEVMYQVVPGSNLAPSLTQQAIVWGVKVQSIIPLEREYGALQALQYYDLCNQIVQAKPSGRLDFNQKQIAAYQDVWNVNRAQSAAINAALTNEGFSLIQGPPGSGKTKTIVAIVGGLLTQALSGSSAATKISLPKAGGNMNDGADAPPKKLLVCAPSNAAVDELVMRLKAGVKTKTGRDHLINIVRIGRSEAINQQVLDVTMDELVAKRLGSTENEQKLRDRNSELFKEHSKVSNDLKEQQAKRDASSATGKELDSMEADLAALRKKKRELGSRIDNAKDAERNAGREAELNRKKAQQAVLDQAHVICATLSGSGHDMFQSLNIDLDTVIIDEAAQCVEMSSLIPLKYGCVKCIMVGDPKQLPPTVFSKEAARFQYEQSLFVRMQKNHPDEVHLLDTQYRMHPQISLFPSRTFYDDLLKDGPNMGPLRVQPWHKSALLAPYRFFDVAGQHQAAPKGHSLVNLAEIEIAMALYQRLLADFPTYDFTSKIGIITPYKSQLHALKNRFPHRFGNEVLDNVEFNTTDAFQGRESEIIIFSCVRASASGGIGFLQDIRRMNVGLTRAKSSLWVLGNSESLVRGQYWKKLVVDAQARDCYTSGDLKSMLNKPSSAFPAAQMPTASMMDVNSHVSQMPNGNTGTGTNLSGTSARRVHADTTLHMSHDSTAQSDRMEGIRYRFEDRIKKKAPPSEGGASDRSTPFPPSETEDVDMENMDDATETKIASGTASRSGTPMSVEGGGTDQVNGAPTTVKARPGYVAPPKVAPHVKKRLVASPFMPRKQPKPRPS